MKVFLLFFICILYAFSSRGEELSIVSDVDEVLVMENIPLSPVDVQQGLSVETESDEREDGGMRVFYSTSSFGRIPISLWTLSSNCFFSDPHREVVTPPPRF